MDISVFMGVNVAIDVEPLLVMTFDLNYPLHGYCHTLFIGSFVGLAFAAAAYPFRRLIGKGMNHLHLPYSPTFASMALSGVLGAWLHIFFDALMYADIEPFYPAQANPLYGHLSINAVYGICAASFVPALVIYILVAFAAKTGRADR
jgi:membrane-bound metal-dependent hydrolase YbcI (DUF457 family)